MEGFWWLGPPADGGGHLDRLTREPTRRKNAGHSRVEPIGESSASRACPPHEDKSQPESSFRILNSPAPKWEQHSGCNEGATVPRSAAQVSQEAPWALQTRLVSDSWLPFGARTPAPARGADR